MNIKKIKRIVLIISCPLSFIIMFYVFKNIVTMITRDRVAVISTSVLVGLVPAINVGRLINSRYLKQEREESQKRIKYIAQTKNCEFCYSELKFDRNSEEIANEFDEKEYIVKEIYSCPQCHYVVSNNSLYRNRSKKKVYKYCEIIDNGDIAQTQIEKGNLYNALCILDIIDNEK